jgi:N-acetylmuramic acid 6-phosphate (MurNAc-6-P) etherase
VKTAVVMLRHGLGEAAAQAVLHQAGGSLRRALAVNGPHGGTD